VRLGKALGMVLRWLASAGMAEVCWGGDCYGPGRGQELCDGQRASEGAGEIGDGRCCTYIMDHVLIDCLGRLRSKLTQQFTCASI